MLIFVAEACRKNFMDDFFDFTRIKIKLLMIYYFKKLNDILNYYSVVELT